MSAARSSRFSKESGKELRQHADRQRRHQQRGPDEFDVAAVAFDSAASRDDTDAKTGVLRQLALVMDTQADPAPFGDGWYAAGLEACAEGLHLLRQNQGMAPAQQKLATALSSRIAAQLIALAIDGVYMDGSMVGAACLRDVRGDTYSYGRGDTCPVFGTYASRVRSFSSRP